VTEVTGKENEIEAGTKGVSVEEEVTCPSGHVISGGGKVKVTGSDIGALSASYPSGKNGWIAVAVTSEGKSGGTIGVTPYVICGS
jgi:hypothetical protein